ncbi:MAG: CapA family protein [Bacteroidia bacterium]|nr:CapA family protein [Bacteroidia bacterium]
MSEKYFYIITVGILAFKLDCFSLPQSGVLEKENKSIIIGITGDVMLGRLVNEHISRTNYSYPWGNMLNMLKSNDLNLINLETTLTTSTKKVLKVFNYKADPDKVQCLIEARIDVVNLANNHILDFSERGLIETIATLDKAGIKHVGSGVNKKEALSHVVIKKKGITIGILGFTDNESSWEAEENKPGTNYLRVGDIEKIENQIKRIRDKVDILIFSFHWGPNMRQKPTEEFQTFAHKVIDLGVDIFHGHSAHIFQGIEIYQGNVILYDTGGFVDDYAVDPLLRNDQSFLYLMEVSKNGVQKVELVPVLISYMQVNQATGSDYREIVNKVKTLSEEFGTKIIETNEGLFVELKG